MSIMTCACCGSDVTVPYFFNGKVYGYTCIKRVNPTAKRDKAVWVLADSVEIKMIPNTHSAKITAMVQGKKLAAGGVFFELEDALKGIYNNWFGAHAKQTDQGVFIMIKDKNGKDMYLDKYTGKSLF